MKKNVHSATYGSDVRSRPAAPEDRTINRRGLLCPLSMLACGLLLGAAARLFDIFCPTLGEIFSQCRYGSCSER